MAPIDRAPAWRRLLDRAGLRWADEPALSPAHEALFAEHSQRMTVRALRILLYFLLIANCLAWPWDFVIFADEPRGLRAFLMFRVVLAPFAILLLWLLRKRSVRESKALVPAVVILICIAMGVGGFSVGNVGGLEQPFFYPVYTFAGLGSAFFVPMRQRIVITYGVTLAFVVPFFGLHPAHLHHPRLLSVLQVLLTSDLCYILLGHVMYVLSRIAFAQGLSLSRKAEELEVAHQKSDRLLLNILPGAIAARLKEEQRPIADGFTEVSVLFADIVGFTSLASNMPPQRLVQLLNSIFSDFDKEVDRLALEKIKTIGDAYMVAGGLPLPRADHADAIAALALAMQGIIRRYREGEQVPLRLRVGIHSGPVIAGVIGFKKFIYDLWGDTVNTASRMESHGLPDEIQITDATRERLSASFIIEPRGSIDIKGMGPMSTYWLKGRVEPNAAP